MGDVTARHAARQQGTKPEIWEREGKSDTDGRWKWEQSRKVRAAGRREGGGEGGRFVPSLSGWEQWDFGTLGLSVWLGWLSRADQRRPESEMSVSFYPVHMF